MTLESWSMGIVRPVMQVFPFAWIFFVPFILITSFAVLNLFIGIIVDAMQIHGGMGYAEESPVSRYFVDARVLSIFEGAEETLALRVVGKALLDGTY